MAGRISFVFLIEVILITATTLLLIRPKFLFRSESPGLKSFAHWAGMILLCLTFCWSVILGIALGINGVILSV